LLDEHLTSLDIIAKKQTMNLIAKWRNGRKPNMPTVLMVTHDLDYALNFSDRILMISGGKVIKNISQSDAKFWDKSKLFALMEQ